MIWTQVSSSLPVLLQPRVDPSLHQWQQNILLLVCCSWHSKRLWFFAITAPHRARRSSMPSAFAQSICAELATGWGFGSAGLQAAGRVFQQTEVPLGTRRGDRTGNRFLCCRAKTAAVRWTQTGAQSTLAGGSEWVLNFGSEWNRQQSSGETSALGCFVLICRSSCIKAGTDNVQA